MIDLSPREFEDWVARWLRAVGGNLGAFQVSTREQVYGADGGAYEIDVLAKFEALGADFTVLVEAKHWKHAVGREVVQVLHSRLSEVGAQKGMLFTTSTFQRGALQFAKTHGIALVEVADGRTCYMTRSASPEPVDPPPWVALPEMVGWVVSATDNGHTASLVTESSPTPLADALGLPPEA